MGLEIVTVLIRPNNRCKLKALVIGSGGREHALVWKLLQSPEVTQVFCIPGNAGTATMARCRNVSLSIDDFEGMLRFAQVQGVAFTIVGPELPLALGIVDFFQEADSPIFGPTKEGAQIESSKAWAKTLMAEAGIPTAASATFKDLDQAKAYVQHHGAPIVVKADGLASGKGVTVAMTVAEAIAALEQILGGQFGQAGETVVIEEFMAGSELSVLAVTDGVTIRPLQPAQDHKRLLDGDEGPNTGGMGAYSPAPLATPSLMTKIQTKVLEPAVAALQARGIDYRGCLYAGLMITPEGEPKVVEFNCRLGDPETQAILPLRGKILNVASAGGGLWKTVNAGTTWTPVFDGEGSYSIGTVAIVATTLTVAVIIIAPRLTLAAIGGALTGLGSRLLKSSFEGQ